MRDPVHGPYIECNNAGCRRRGLSGMHCRDNDECDEGPWEDCVVLAKQDRDNVAVFCDVSRGVKNGLITALCIRREQHRGRCVFSDE